VAADRLKVLTAEILAALRERHDPDSGEWVLLEEALRIDALALRCWQGGRSTLLGGSATAGPRPEGGDGLVRISYEIKASRQDFLRELARPEKRRRAVELSDLFYFVAPDGMIAPHELPPEAGLVEVMRSGSSWVRVPAPWRAHRALG